MKKFFVILLFLIFFTISFFSTIKNHTYAAKEITNDCKIGIDFDKNKVIDDSEYFSVNGIKPFCTDENIKTINRDATARQIEGLKKQTRDFYYEIFFNQPITIKNGSIFISNKNAAELILTDGHAVADSEFYKTFESPERITENFKSVDNTEYFRLNLKSLTYHTTDCPKGKSGKRTKIVTANELPNKAKPCPYCLSKKIKMNDDTLPAVSTIQTKYLNSPQITIFRNGGVGVYKPSYKCNTEMCKALNNQINRAKTSIDAAVYDINNQPEIIDAFKSAKNRGVSIRVVTDADANNNIKNEGVNSLKNIADLFVTDFRPGKSDSKRLMHNKFIIIDNKTVITGSTNYTSTGITGFNANTLVVIHSEQIAKLYSTEFNNFVSGKFHSEKSSPQNNENIRIDNKTLLNIYFSPQNKTISEKILPEIRKSKKYIYTESYSLTHKGFAEELIKAHKRGVEIKIIIDATTAANKYTIHKDLRKNGINVKTENFAGKMHMKNIIIDGETVITGSMNFTKSGDIYNDENTIFIKSQEIARYFTDNFLKIYERIPDIYLKYDPPAESNKSIGSCTDGIDNDFDGDIDSKDKGCKKQ